MAQIIRDRVFGSFGGSRRHAKLPIPVPRPEPEPEKPKPVYPAEDLPNPFGQLGPPELSDADLRDAAYEILVGACRSSGGPKPLTYTPQSEKSVERSSMTSLQRSLTSSAKVALGLKQTASSKRLLMLGSGKRAGSVYEVIRVQMRVSEQADTRIRRALLRVAAGQLGRKIESMVLPLELLQHFRVLDFGNQLEYEHWQRRTLKVLEAGLLLYPHLALDRRDTAPQQLRKIINAALEKPGGAGKSAETMQALRSVVMSLTCRTFDGTVSETCHWADGFPFNLRLYQKLLESCFDLNDETSIIEDLDEVLEVMKKTWVVLGINQILHNLCFAWVLFHRYVTTGQVDNDLLSASNNLLVEVQQDANATKDPAYLKIVSSTLSAILGWTEKRLLAYRSVFNPGNTEVMQNIVNLGVLSAKILVEDISHDYRRKKKEVDVARDRVDSYIRSSMRTAFAQKLEKLGSNKRLPKSEKNYTHTLSVLANEVSELAFSEKGIYGPVLKRWHPYAIGVAMATLHYCYGDELKQFVDHIMEFTPDTVQVLKAADKLEKDLVQIAVEDSVDSEDGGKSIIQEMPPYEAEAVMGELANDWIRTRVDRLKEWIDRNLQQEVWNPQANKERLAPSAIEVLRIIDETLEAFFMLPIPMHPGLIPELKTGLDRCLQYYVSNAKTGSGNRTTFIPSMPALTRCSAGSKFHSVFKKKERSHINQRRKAQVGSTTGDSLFGIPQLCVRINTLQLIRTELGVFEKRILAHLGSLGSTQKGDLVNGTSKMFEMSASACLEGIQQLCEATAYKVVFQELNHVLWDSLYNLDAASCRIEPFLQELEQFLEIISSTVHDRVRTRVITDVMKASFEGFLLVLLAGGPTRSFTQRDCEVIKEDLKFLTDLFWSGGDGLPADLIEKLSTTVKDVLPLYHTDTDTLIEQFKCAMLEKCGSSGKFHLTLPPTPDNWNSNDPNTLLRVLCHRNDETAAKYLKKTYNLPKKF